MNMKFIVIWAIFLTVCLLIVLLSRRIQKQIKEEGIETKGVISRVVDEGGPDEVDIRVYASYRTEDGEEVEGILANAPTDLDPGQRVLIKYHPRYKMNARLIEVLGNREG